MLMGTVIVRNVMEQRFAGTVQMLCSRPRRAGYQVDRAGLGLEVQRSRLSGTLRRSGSFLKHTSDRGFRKGADGR